VIDLQKLMYYIQASENLSFVIKTLQLCASHSYNCLQSDCKTATVGKSFTQILISRLQDNNISQSLTQVSSHHSAGSVAFSYLCIISSYQNSEARE